MFKHILVAVDGSESSRLALHEAANLAREQQARLRIVHVVDEVKVHWEMEFADLAALREAAIQSGREILNRAKLVAQDAGVEAEAKLLEIGMPGGRIADKIAQEAGAWPADLIVAGTHGRRGFNHLLMGSVAEGVLRVAPTPLLLIPRR